MSDEQLVKRAQKGNKNALDTIMDRFRDFVGFKSRSYYLVGADREDIIQEGMIGLYKAVRDYRDDRHTSFKAFAEVCITRQIITAVKTATRQKHTPLNSYVSLNSTIGNSGDNQERVFMDFLVSDEICDPVELVIGGEEALSIKDNFSRMLSGLETEVLLRYMRGRSYQEIAVELDRQVKSVDNALQRIKRKVEQHLEYRECLAEGIVIKKTGHSRSEKS
ncbi:MAG: RNA polymerase sporulation sigma factor SigH [Actinobacteria bacterium]|nr:RNA polymerase sporulation sigma factor SigH [Actinomycetota bacterium]